KLLSGGCAQRKMQIDCKTSRVRPLAQVTGAEVSPLSPEERQVAGQLQALLAGEEVQGWQRWQEASMKSLLLKLHPSGAEGRRLFLLEEDAKLDVEEALMQLPPEVEQLTFIVGDHIGMRPVAHGRLVSDFGAQPVRLNCPPLLTSQCITLLQFLTDRHLSARKSGCRSGKAELGQLFSGFGTGSLPFNFRGFAASFGTNKSCQLLGGPIQPAMSRVASVVCAVSLALYGASCFILPASTPRGAPQQGAGAVAQQPSAAATQESAGSWSPLAIGAALGLLAAVATTRPALAADLENGEAVFQGNCTACHAGGNNSIVAEKKLKKDALVTYGKYDVSAIITQVTNGNGSMPAFGDKLGPDDIEDVANYVYNKADKW
ncbi:unnamed protein product, partial [Effrenium voratum]